MNKAKRVLIYVNYYVPGYKSGGPIQSIKNLAEELKDYFDINIITLDRDATDKKAYQGLKINKWYKTNDINVYYAKKSLLIYNIIKETIKAKNEIIYFNSLFNPYFTLLPLLLLSIRNNNNKIIIAVRGELADGSLSNKKIKKLLAIKLIKHLFDVKNVYWHATHIEEQNEIKRIFPNIKKVVVAPNIATSKRISIIPKEYKILKIIYLARIHPHKNLLFVLDVVDKLNINVQLDVYGPVRSNNYWAKCKNKIETINNKRNISIRYMGSIKSYKVLEIYKEYHVYFLPTQGENYGHSIIEAAIAGLPILISNKTPWKELTSKGVGWDLNLDNIDKFINALRQYNQLSDYEKNNMSKKVQEWAIKTQNKSEIIKKYKELFS